MGRVETCPEARLFTGLSGNSATVHHRLLAIAYSVSVAAQPSPEQRQVTRCPQGCNNDLTLVQTLSGAVVFDRG